MTSYLVLPLLLGFLHIKECLLAQVDVSPPELLVLPGNNATFMCRVAVPLQYCRVVVPGRAAVNLNSRTTSGEISYHGAGLEAGQCGFVINRVDDMNNGVVKCTLGILTETHESVGTMQLVVAHAPKRPELDISHGTDSLRVYKLNDQLQASCMVKDGRPAANITWFLDDEELYGEGLGMPTVVDYAKESTQTKIQNFTRILRASDNGKSLRCVAYHPAYTSGRSEISRRLDVKYAPLPLDGPLDKFGYQLGELGVIKLIIEANPKPQIEWNIDGQRIREGSNDNTGRLEAESAKDIGRGKYEVNLRIAAINKQDTEKEYILTAYNDMGSESYRLKISTNPEPEGLELGAGAIVGIVAAILILLLFVFLIVFAKVSGRWCFKSEKDSSHIAESSDTESTDVRPSKHLRISPIKLTSFFKKNRDKNENEGDEEYPAERNLSTDTTDVKDPPESAENQTAEKDNVKSETKEGLVYAELDLVSPNLKPVVKNDDERTEYAEIVYTAKDEQKTDQ